MLKKNISNQLSKKYLLKSFLYNLNCGDFIIVKTYKGSYRSVFPGLVIKVDKKAGKIILRNLFKRVLIEKSFNINSPSLTRAILFKKFEYPKKRFNLFYVKSQFQSFKF